MKLIALAVSMVLIVGNVVAEECVPLPPGPDCAAIHKSYPNAKSGVYSITVPGKSSPLQVYCDMDTACGGWTVFQRRKDGTENFKRNWFDYANGFGNLTGEFWLGNEYLAALTKVRPYRLRIDFENWAGLQTFAEYNFFKVSEADTKYQLSYTACSYFGDAGDGMAGSSGNLNHNGNKFSTIDQDNDNNAASCANIYHGGWWYNSCHASNLNGQYNNTKFAEGITWHEKYTDSLKFVEMKMR